MSILFNYRICHSFVLTVLFLFIRNSDSFSSTQSQLCYSSKFSFFSSSQQSYSIARSISPTCTPLSYPCSSASSSSSSSSSSHVRSSLHNDRGNKMRLNMLRHNSNGIHSNSYMNKVKSSSTRMNAIPSTTIASALVVAGVIAFHEAGHYFAARWQNIKVLSYNIGYGPKLLSYNDTTMNTEFALRALPLGGYVAFPPNVVVDETTGEVIEEIDDPNLLQNKSPLSRAVVISGGVIANILLTFLLSAGTAATVGIGRPVFSEGILVSSVPAAQTPGVKAGILPRDVIRKVNGENIVSSERAVQDFIRVVRANTNKELVLEIERQGKTFSAKVVPEDMGGGRGAIGVGVNANVKSVDNVKATDPLQAARMGVDETMHLLAFTFAAFSTAVSTGLTGNEVGGPIAVVKAGAQMAEISPVALVGFAATLSVNLAILNSLPFPALDGGQLAFVLVEIVAGRPVPKRIQENITTLAFFILLVLGSSTVIADISKL